jgi:hypothetical protein
LLQADCVTLNAANSGEASAVKTRWLVELPPPTHTHTQEAVIEGCGALVAWWLVHKSEQSDTILPAPSPTAREIKKKCVQRGPKAAVNVSQNDSRKEPNASWHEKHDLRIWRSLHTDCRHKTGSSQGKQGHILSSWNGQYCALAPCCSDTNSPNPE